eukprot:TRINITY_DN1279_c0_g1_i1.p1 TRINITY_DN1279_c0_g1~~TRINITY_DN1279_c0_g1_i1.p1  ORF type:complete len:263 (+),score=79.48 TRINITY_DN1279_c0_g1_i1:291-1079(+)
MKVVPVPVLDDNYAYLLIDESKKTAAAVDPVKPQIVLDAAKEHGVTIESILTTHHHWDHAGGNDEFLKIIGSKIPVYGGDERVQAVSNLVKEGNEFKVGSLEVKVHFTPCHTSGHVLYQVKDPSSSSQQALFTGDTLFVAGCGRFFEGNAQQMYHNLVEVVAKLPEDTKVYVGHEYTVKNLQFAATIEPKNENLLKKLEWSKMQRETKQPTVPSTVAEEKSFNPFVRCTELSVAKGVGLAKEDNSFNPVEVMAELRKRKDNF